MVMDEAEMGVDADLTEGTNKMSMWGADIVMEAATGRHAGCGVATGFPALCLCSRATGQVVDHHLSTYANTCDAGSRPRPWPEATGYNLGTRAVLLAS